MEASQLYQLVMALGQNTTITSLALGSLEVSRDTEPVIEWIVGIPLINHTIQKFKATHLAGLADKHVRMLADAVSRNHTIRAVDISHNHDVTIGAKIGFIARLATHPSMLSFRCKTWGSINFLSACNLYRAVAGTSLIDVSLSYDFALDAMSITHALEIVAYRLTKNVLWKIKNHIHNNDTKFASVRRWNGTEMHPDSPDIKAVMVSGNWSFSLPRLPHPRGTRIEEITIYHVDLSDDVLDLIIWQPRLKRLVLTACGIGRDPMKK